MCRNFLRDLEKNDRLLLSLRDELYDGSFDDMKKDLEERLDGKPYIIKLVKRLEEDLESIRKIDAFEKKHNVNLAGYLMEMEKKHEKHSRSDSVR